MTKSSRIKELVAKTSFNSGLFFTSTDSIFAQAPTIPALAAMGPPSQ